MIFLIPRLISEMYVIYVNRLSNETISSIIEFTKLKCDMFTFLSIIQIITFYHKIRIIIIISFIYCASSMMDLIE